MDTGFGGTELSVGVVQILLKSFAKILSKTQDNLQTP